jgi:hypothetical protein
MPAVFVRKLARGVVQRRFGCDEALRAVDKIDALFDNSTGHGAPN